MTLPEIITALITNADFEEVASVAKAKSFITAAKRWLILAPGSSSQGGASMSLNTQQVLDLLKRAQLFVQANDSASGSSRPRVAFLGVGARQ